MGVRVLGIVGVAGLLLGGQAALGQGITLDGSLGAGGTLTGPVYVIPQGVGTTVGTNLFHSFGRFNLAAGEAANFESAAAIRNILARVTGGSPSSIDGLIFTTSPAVNLFLINPAGITFGPNARLDIGGTVRGGFTATTLDAVVWPDGSRFEAVNPGGPQPLLRIVGDPRGFWASQRQISGIVANRSGLGVYPNQDLRLLGGAVSLSGGWLEAQDGRVAVGAVTGAGTVGLDSEGRLTVPGAMARGDVRVNGMDIVVAGERGGDVQLVAENLAIANRSAVLGGVVPGAGSPNNRAGDVQLEATGRVQIEGPETFILNYLQPNAIGQGGEIVVRGREIVISNAILITTTFGQGNAGEVRLEATDQVLLQDAAVFSGTFPNASGDGGAIRIASPRIDLLDNTFVDAAVDSPGRGGAIVLRASEQLRIADRSRVSSYVGPDGVGQGGDVILETPKLLVEGGSLLSVVLFGQGEGGRLLINTTQAHHPDSPGFVRIQDSLLLGFVMPQGRGKGGSIAIETGTLQLENSSINAALIGEGQSGSIQIAATDQMSLHNASIVTLVSDEAKGAGGNVDLMVGSLLMDQESQVNTATLGQGDAGDVVIRAIAGPRPQQTGAVVIDGRLDDRVTGLFSGVGIGAIGQGGDITVEAQSLTLQSGEIDVGTNGQGAAGNVRIEVVDRVSISGGEDGVVSGVGLRGVGQGGSITIWAADIEMTQGANLFASTLGQGNAGAVQLNARNKILIDGFSQSDGLPTSIYSLTLGQGLGGPITLTAPEITISNGGVIDSESLGNQRGGDIIVTAGRFSLLNGGQLLTSSFRDGPAGSIQIQASESVRIAGVDPNFEARQVLFPGLSTRYARESLLEARSFQTGAAGNITVTAPTLVLEDGAQIITDSNAVTGGNIDLNLDQALVMRNGSLISATAGRRQGAGDGGNIIINAPFVLSQPGENNDIIANAFSGTGGKITIDAEAILNFTLNDRQPFDTLRAQPTNDISASSQFGSQGVLNLVGLNVDPSRGAFQLPTGLTDASDRLDTFCTPGGGSTRSEFTLRGSGGIPETPLEHRLTAIDLTEWAVEEVGSRNAERGRREVGSREWGVGSGESAFPLPPSDFSVPTSAFPVEADSILITSDGQVHLVATQPGKVGLPPVNCDRKGQDRKVQG